MRGEKSGRMRREEEEIDWEREEEDLEEWKRRGILGRGRDDWKRKKRRV